MLRNGPQNSNELIIIKKKFLNDLIWLCSSSRDNRRTILQMSVWQEFLIGLAHVYPINNNEIEITDLVFKLFKILLNHATKFEYGGWRVWIDTLSILHSRVSKEDYQLKINKIYEDYEKPNGNTNGNNNSNNDENDQKAPFQLPSFRIPEFRWSHMHKRLLSDMLDSIETEIYIWKTNSDNLFKSLIELINHSDNAIFCVNTIHIVSQLADILTNACGGLLPLLASATTINSVTIFYINF